jgi:hypothetical protein
MVIWTPEAPTRSAMRRELGAHERVERLVGQAASLLLALTAFFLVPPSASGETVFPLKVAPSGRYLADQTGTPFFVNGATPWSLTRNLTYDEAVRYMENRQQKGINALIISVPDAYAPDGSYSFPPDQQGQHPFVGDDITRPNEAYWQHVDRVFHRDLLAGAGARPSSS